MPPTAWPHPAAWIEFAYHDEEGWLVLIPKPAARRQPSLASKLTQQRGYAESPAAERIWASTAETPAVLYHGTSVDAALTAAAGMGLRAGAELVAHGVDVPIHTPDGVYSYGVADISADSIYTQQGAQVVFESVGITVGKASSDLACRPIPGFDGKIEVLEGCRVRRFRSAARRARSWSAAEWIHHPDSITIIRVRLHPWALEEFVSRTEALALLNQPVPTKQPDAMRAREG